MNCKKIKLPKIPTLIQIKMHRLIIGKITSVTISKNASNTFYISILTEQTVTKLKEVSSVIGIDLGLKSLAVTST
ncbi:hypothetical protein AN639_06320 [Candidatus Epulonipiscium fishelsonii]|uniref:Uncharacterized protein n=1 Tax=Candidatus Epulonipiscium fishelsonii TaxID=77094 RepID=A0ACC8XAY4_9FIRM|nr:hypothetical protein AN639_06320 [Epulopiscium sp. SCG-B05WGA-EpuloA1]ONI39474.1 hypothetical protein AN396_08715 [Epulopiscium sp. SCG-B11WGA-EpuloA1]